MRENIAALMMVTYNRLELTKQTLDNIFKNTKPPYNLVIVDNGSTDGTKQYLFELTEKYKSSDIKLVCQYNDENNGIAIGRNQALLLANNTDETAWYATIDNDILVPAGWLEECIAVLKASPKYGMIGVNMEGVVYGLVSEGGKTFQRKPQGNLGTACMVFPKSLHKMLGFFNTEYKNYAHEDADFGMRARVLGYQLGYIKENGKHIGEGENDVGEYREFKNKHHKENLQKFYENSRLYMSKQKSIYIPYKD
jgi:GT2 family glycosyltransferase